LRFQPPEKEQLFSSPFLAHCSHIRTYRIRNFWEGNSYRAKSH
jgi:hypothetical protein